jgi:hypothetical protein
MKIDLDPLSLLLQVVLVHLGGARVGITLDDRRVCQHVLTCLVGEQEQQLLELIRQCLEPVVVRHQPQMTPLRFGRRL